MRRTPAVMEPLAQLREKIANFPGYDGDLRRRRSDEYVRSYLGEALAELTERCALSSELEQRADDLMLRLGFADPKDFAGHDIGSGSGDAGDGGAVARADLEVVELADRAASLDAAAIPSYFDEVTAALDAREVTLRASAAKMR
jgi:hypothetical protein